MYILFYNPISRSGNGEQSLNEVIELLDTDDYEAINVLEVEDFQTLVDSKSVDDVFVVIGGDGTISKFINLIPIIPQKIMIYAGGTGNDFMRNFEGDLIEYDDSVDKPVVQTDELTKVCNGFGTGIDTMVLKFYNEAKTKSKLSYFYNTLKSFLLYKPITVEVSIDGEKKTFNKVYLVSVSNGKYFGGGMMIAPDAKVDDGMLDVVIVHDISRFNLFRIFPKIYSGKHIEYKKYVYYKQGKNIEITQKESRNFSTDGELGRKVYNNFKVSV